jgi:hydrogenase small subunit
MNISRRQFLKYCTAAAGAIGLSTTDLVKLEKAFALEGGLNVTWVNGQACTGCTVTLANSMYYSTVQELLALGQASTSVDLNYIETLMAAMSNEATQNSEVTASPFVLALEGAIPSSGYCTVGTWTGAASEDIGDVVTMLANHANCIAVLGIGTCACFGGIPAARGNVTGAKGLESHLGNALYRSKVINIPGCPPNPNWIVGTIAYVIATGHLPSVDSLRRPRDFYGERICNNCDRFAYSKAQGQTLGFIQNSAPNDIGDPAANIPGAKCLKKVGCKGSRTKSDCSLRKWHSNAPLTTGVNWCVGAGAPCQGCTQKNFPDRFSPFQYIR